VSKADAAAAILWVGATFYALFGGADFGGGFWDLIAGDADKGERPRALIQRSLTPVWEANHVWLIFILVVLWTAFPPAFSAIFSTLYVPIALAAVGIVLRGAGFAFRKSIEGLAARRAAGATFALSSVLTPFFMGAVVGAIASGNVPADGNGDAFSSWLEPLPLLTGAMFVATGAYLSAVFLVGDARRAGEEGLERYFVRRALAAAAVAGAAAAVGLVELHAEARYIFDRLVNQGLPLVIASALCGLGLLALLATLIEPYRMDRLTGFLHPGADATGTGFQAAQAKIALGSGGIFGVGIGNGVGKAYYLPEAHTDMISAVIGEELGMFGIFGVVGLFGLFGYAGLRVAQRARDRYSKLLVAGLTSLVVLQATINLFAVMGLAPLTGVPLPFVSYGNSSLMTSLFAIGLILNVARGGTAKAARAATGGRAGKLRVVEGGRTPSRERSRASGARKAKGRGGSGGNRGSRGPRHGGRRRASG